MTTTTTNTNASVNVVNKEEKDMMNMTKNEIREMLKNAGVELSNTVFKKTKKADLIAMLTEATPITEESVVEKKEEKDMKEKYNAAVWDKLVKALATEYVKQSLNRSWVLFYKNMRATTTKSEYLVKSNRLWGVTSKVIKTMYGEANCNENYIQQALNAMVVRGYLNFQKVQGRNGVNVVFNATKDQMNAMYKLSKQ